MTNRPEAHLFGMLPEEIVAQCARSAGRDHRHGGDPIASLRRAYLREAITISTVGLVPANHRMARAPSV